MSDSKEPEEGSKERKEQLEEAGEKVKETAKGFWKFLHREGIRGKRKLDKAMAISRVQTQIAQHQRHRETLFMEMGTKVYALFQKQGVKNPDLLALCEQVRALYGDEEKLNAEIEKIKAEEEVPAEPEPAPEAPPAEKPAPEAPVSEEPVEVEPAPEEPAPEVPSPPEPPEEEESSKQQ